MSTYGTWNGSGVTNVANYEHLLLNYIFDEWSILDPAKGPEMETYDPTLKTQPVIFKPGYASNNRHYQVTCRRISSRRLQNTQTRGHWIFEIILAVHTKARRMVRPKSQDGPPPGIPEQLENMEQEVERILMEPKIGDIPGVMKLEYMANDRIYLSDDSFQKMEWESITGALMWIDKMTLSSPV